MGVSVPAMLMTTGVLSANEVRRLKDHFANRENFRGVAILEPGVDRWAGRRYQGPCAQCGAPDETGAHVCAYCLSPRVTPDEAEMIEVTTLEDCEPRYVSANPFPQAAANRR